MSQRFILRFSGPSAPAEEIQRLKQRLKVVDESARMLLVDGDASTVERLAQEFPRWKASPEVQYRVPEPRVRVKKSLK